MTTAKSPAILGLLPLPRHRRRNRAPSGESSQVRFVELAETEQLTFTTSIRLRIQHYTENRVEAFHRLTVVRLSLHDQARPGLPPAAQNPCPRETWLPEDLGEVAWPTRLLREAGGRAGEASARRRERVGPACCRRPPYRRLELCRGRRRTAHGDDQRHRSCAVVDRPIRRSTERDGDVVAWPTPDTTLPRLSVMLTLTFQASLLANPLAYVQVK